MPWPERAEPERDPLADFVWAGAVRTFGPPPGEVLVFQASPVLLDETQPADKNKN